MRPHKNILLILMSIISLCFSVNSVSGQNCRNFGFENDSDLIHFNGNIGQSDLASKEGIKSLIIKDAQPGHDQEVEASVISNDGPGVIKFFWGKRGGYAKFFKLSFYFDNKYIDECKNTNDLGSTKFYYKVQDDGKTIHTMKWVLNYKESGYAGAPPTIPPTADALIDGLELCNMRFQDQLEEENTTGIGGKEVVETSKIQYLQNISTTDIHPEENNTTNIMETKVIEILKIEPDSDRDLQGNINMIKEMQGKGNNTIKRLILSPGNYSLKDSLTLDGLNDLSIECENYEEGNLASIINTSLNKTKIIIANCNNVDIKGLKTDSGISGIYLIRSYTCEISNNIIINCNKSGILLENSTGNNINNNKIDSTINHSTGISLLNSSSNDINLNSITVDNSCYTIIFESKDNNITDDNNFGLINVFNKFYQICVDSEGFKELQNNKDCSRRIVCVNNNIFEKSAI